MGYSRPRLITLQGGHGTTSPLDATTYYFGIYAATALSATETSLQIKVPYNGTIRYAQVHAFSATTTGTNEAWEYFLRNSTTTTDYSLGTVSAATSNRRWEADLLIPVTKGDLLCFKTTTPTWATNPDGHRAWAYVVLEVA